MTTITNALLHRILAKARRRNEESTAIVKSEWLPASFLPDRHWKRVFITGFPGAGNVITSAIATQLRTNSTRLESEPTPDRPTIGVLHGFATHYNAVLEILSQSVPLDWNAKAYFQNAERDKADFFVLRPDMHIVVVCRVSLGAYLNGVVHSTHQVPSPETIRFYADKGYASIVVVRHPLDILTSLASKFSRGDARLTPGRYIADRAWLRGTASLLADFYRPALPFANQINIVRYEDCLANPIGFVQRVGQVLGLEVSEVDAEEPASMVGTKEFSPRHFNRPGTDKWRDFFTPDLLDAVRDAGIWDVFEPLGYHEPAPQSARGIAFAEPSLKRQIWVGVYYNYIIGTFEPSRIAEAYGLPPLPSRWAGSHLVVGSDQRFVDQF